AAGRGGHRCVIRCEPRQRARPDAHHPPLHDALPILLDFIKSESRVKYPEVREPHSNEWKRISWDEALTRIARHMKDDRDKNFETHDEQGRLVNRWLTTSMVAASACTNETAYLTQKITRALGILQLDNQARV